MKKTRWIWISALLIMALSAALCTFVSADVDLTLTLEKVGEIPEETLDYEDIKIYPSGLIAEDAEGNYYVLDEMGNNNLGRSYGNASFFTDELFKVYDAATWPISCGLVKADGTVVLPCEAAIINSVNDTDRYVEVSVATEPTDKEHAFIYTYDGWVAWPDEDSEYYDGYKHYYDLKEGKYIDTLDEADPSGFQGRYTYEQGDDDKYSIVAPDGTVVTELDSWPSEIYGEGEFFAMKQDDGYIVVDRNGAPISEFKFKAPPDVINGYLSAVKTEDDKAYTVMDFEGNIYVDGEDNIPYVNEKAYGFTLLGNPDDKNLLLYPDGTLAELGKYNNGGDLPFYKRGSDGEPDQFFVLEKGAYQDLGEEHLVNSNMESSLIIQAKADGEEESSLYNTIDGSVLMEKAGTDFYTSDYWVYVLKDGVWGVYKVVVNN